MFFNHYNNLSDKKFLSLKARLRLLEDKYVIPFCRKNSFYLDRERYYNESLAINLYRKVADITDHIGLYYLDKKGAPLFTFYLSKYYDSTSHRYMKNINLIEGKGIDEFEDKIEALLNDALEKIDSLNREDLDESFSIPSLDS